MEELQAIHRFYERTIMDITEDVQRRTRRMESTLARRDYSSLRCEFGLLRNKMDEIFDEFHH